MIIRPACNADLPQIVAIYNDAVLTTTALWDESPTDLDERGAWLSAKATSGLPVLACDVDGALIGYATFGPFRPWLGYRRTVEHSVYVAADQRRRGAASLLLGALIDAARQRGCHAMVGGIEARNRASLALHAAFGFETAGTLRQVGIKFGAWLDLTFVLLLLDRQPRPVA